MAEMEAKFRVTVEGKQDLEEFFNRSSQSAESFHRNLSRVLSSAGSTLSSFAGKAQGALSSFGGKELDAGLASGARGILRLRDAITALAVSSGKGGEIVGGLKDQIQSVSRASNQLQEDVTEAMQAFVEKTGDLDTARRNIELYGKAATATGAAIADISRVGVELSDKLNIKDQAAAFAILATQSKAGAIELKDLATKGPRIFAAAASAGATGERGLREAGALAQVYAKGFGGTGSAASVATAIESTFSDILKKTGRLEAAGIKVSGRDQFEVLKDIIRATGGDKGKLLEVFNARSIRGVDVLAREFRSTGRFDTFEKFRDMGGDPNLIAKDFATRSATGEAKLREARINRQDFYDKYLGGIAEFGAEHGTELQLGLGLAGGVGSALSLAGRVLGKGGAKGIGNALTSIGAQRVFVVNAKDFGGGLPGADGIPGGGGGLGGLAMQGLAVAGAGAAGYALGTYLDEKFGLSDKIANAFFERNHPAEPEKTISRPFVAPSTGLKNPNMEIVGIDQLNIHLDSDGNASVEGNGTRAPKVRVLRSSAGGG